MPALQQHWIATVYLSPTTGTVSVGDCLIPDAAGTFHVVATAAARSAASRTSRVSGIALTAGDSENRAVEIQVVGPCPPAITGLGAGTATSLSVGTNGRLERDATPSIPAGDCDADGWAYLNFSGSGSSGGSGFTAGGDLSGTETSQTVEKVKGTTITTAGGALPVGAVLRTTAAGVADWGTVNLADTDAVTGTLPVVRGGTNLTTGDLVGQANKAVTVNVGETGYTFTTIPAGASTPTGTGFRHVTSGTEDAAAKLVENVDVDAAAAIAITKLATSGTRGQVFEAFDSGSGIVNRFGYRDLAAGTTSSTGAVNNLSTLDANNNPTGLMIFTGAGPSLTGLANGTDGRKFVVAYVGAGTMTVVNDSASSTAANRIVTGTGADIVLYNTESVSLWYDSANSRWRVIRSAPTEAQVTNSSTGTLNDVSTINGSSIAAGGVLFTGAAPSVTGFSNGTNGRLIRVHTTGGALVLNNENAGSSAGNRILTGTGGNVTLANGEAALLFYDATNSRWRLVDESIRTQTLLNKTFSVDNNSLVSGTQLNGDMLKSNGTVFGRVARGTANQVWAMNGSGTDSGWVTLSSGANPAGSGSEVQYRSSGTAFGAFANWSHSSGNLLANSSGAISFESGGATTGKIRLKSQASAIPVIVVDDGVGGNRTATLQVDTNNQVNTFGFTAFSTQITGSNVTVSGNSNIYYQIAGSTQFWMSTTAIAVGLPVGGLSQPFRFKRATINMAANPTTATASQAECPLLTLTGGPGSGNWDLILPNVSEAYFVVRQTSGGWGATCKKSGGTGVTVNGAVKMISHDGTDYVNHGTMTT